MPSARPLETGAWRTAACASLAVVLCTSLLLHALRTALGEGHPTLVAIERNARPVVTGGVTK